MAIDKTAPLTLRALGDHLWRSADLFHNKISNQKDYVLALLFFKRASDRHREETGAALGELADQGVPGDAAAKVMTAEREFLMRALQSPDAAANLDWSQVSDDDWDAMFTQQQARADAWEFDTDAAMATIGDVPMVITTARSGRDAAMAGASRLR
jgi:type I restriction-modification system DNA methylase subunit